MDRREFDELLPPPDPGLVGAGHLENAAEEGTILRNNSDPPPPRAPIRLYCRGFPRKLAVYFALLRIHDTTMIAPPISVIGPARLNSFSVREAVIFLFYPLFARIYKFSWDEIYKINLKKYCKKRRRRF